jgi:methyl-accepting chemotaxis protein
MDAPLKRRFLVPVLLLPLLLVLGSAALLLEDLSGQLGRTRTELDGIRYAERLRSVLVDLQALRGLWPLLRQGDGGAAIRFAAARERLTAELGGAVQDPVAQTLDLAPRVAGFHRALDEDLRQLDGEPNPEAIARLGLYVERLRDLILDTADRSRLSLDPELGSAYLIDLFINRLPSLVDAIGQLRAKGTGLIADGSLRGADSRQIERRIEVIRREQEHVERDLRLVNEHNPGLKALLAPRFVAVERDVGRYMAEAQLLAAGRGTSRDALSFFDQGGGTIQVCTAMCRAVWVQLVELLQQRYRALQIRTGFALGGLGSAILVTAYLLMTYYRRERRLIQRLVDRKSVV